MQATLGWRQKQCPLDGYAARLRGSDEDWKLKVDALRDIDCYVRENAATITQENLSCLVVPFRCLFVELRSAVVKEACEVFTSIASNLGQKTKTLLSNVFATLIDARGSTNKVNSSAIHSCIERVLKVVMSRHILSTFFYVSKNSKNGQMRDSCVQYLLIVLQNWTKQHLEPHRNQIQDFIISALSDASPISREVARLCYGSFVSIWPEQTDLFLQCLEPSVKKYLVKQEVSSEKGSSPLNDTTSSDSKTASGNKRKILNNITNTPDTVKRRKNVSSKFSNLPLRVPVARKNVGLDPENLTGVTSEKPAIPKSSLNANSNHETLKSVSLIPNTTHVQNRTTDTCSPELYFNLLCEKKLVEKNLGNVQLKLSLKSDELLRAQETIEQLTMYGEDRGHIQAAVDSNQLIVSENHTIILLQDQLKAADIYAKEKDKMIEELKGQLRDIQMSHNGDSTSHLGESMESILAMNTREIDSLKDQLCQTVQQKDALETELMSMDETISTVQAALLEEQQQVESLKEEIAQLQRSSVSMCSCSEKNTTKNENLCGELEVSHSLPTNQNIEPCMATIVQEHNTADLKLFTNSQIQRLLEEKAFLTSDIDNLRQVLSQNELAWEAMLKNEANKLEEHDQTAKTEIGLLENKVQFQSQEIEDLKATNEILSSSLKTARIEIERALAESNNLTTELNQQKKVSRMNQDHFLVIERELSDVKAERETLSSMAQESAIQVTQLNNMVAPLESKIVHLSQSIADLKAELDQTQESLEAALNEKSQLKGTLDATVEELDHAEERSRELSEEVVQLQDRIQELLSDVQAAESVKSDIQTQMQDLVLAHDQQILALREDDFQRQFRYEKEIKELAATIKQLQDENSQLQVDISLMRDQNDQLLLQCETLETRAFVSSNERDDQVRKLLSEQTALLSEKEVLVVSNIRLTKESSDWKTASEAKQGIIKELEHCVAKLEKSLALCHEKEMAWIQTKTNLESIIAKSSTAIQKHEATEAGLQASLSASAQVINDLKTEQMALLDENKKLTLDQKSLVKALHDAEAKKAQLQNQLLSGLERLRDSKLLKVETPPEVARTDVETRIKEEPKSFPAMQIDKSWKQKLSVAPTLFQSKEQSKASILAQRQLNDANLLKRFQSSKLP